MGINYQVHRAAVNAAKGIRQFQKADKEIDRDHVDSAVRHYDKGLAFFGTALDHVEKAEDDAYKSAASDIDEGNAELQKCIDAYGNGNGESASKHYDKALDHYDRALDTLDA